MRSDLPDDLEARLDRAIEFGSEPTFGEVVMMAEQVEAALRHYDQRDRGRIERIVDKFKAVVEKVAKASEADSFAITVTIPVGLEVSIQWKVDG